MLNGRWVESDEIFSRTQSSIDLEEVEQPVPETESRPSAAAPECEEQEVDNRKAAALKPLRFREVLLSQTDHELSLVQVLCEMCVLLECDAALGAGAQRVLRRAAAAAGLAAADHDGIAEL